MIYFVLIIGFSYFYASIQFNPVEISNNLKRNGGFIPHEGIHGDSRRGQGAAGTVGVPVDYIVVQLLHHAGHAGNDTGHHPATIGAFLPAPTEGSFGYAVLNAIDSKSFLYLVIYFVLTSGSPEPAPSPGPRPRR